MIDAKLLRNSAGEVAKNLARRNFTFDADAYLVLFGLSGTPVRKVLAKRKRRARM